jgi:uncharacterized protein YerC
MDEIPIKRRKTVYTRIHPLTKAEIVRSLEERKGPYRKIAERAGVSTSRISHIAREIRLLKNPPDLSIAKSVILNRNRN